MAPPTAPSSMRSPAARSASATCAHGAHRPQTNGKAERFIRTMLSGWAYGALEAGSPRDFSHPTPRERVDVVVRCRHR